MNILAEELLRGYRSMSIKKGQVILLKGEVPEGVLVIEAGTVSSYTITSDGAERQIGIHAPGEDVPVGYSVGLREQADFFYKAYTDCTVRLVPRGEYMQMLGTNHEALLACYIKLSSRYLSSLTRISALEHPKASDKVAFMLMNMAEQFGTRLRPYKTQLSLAITQQQIADALGLTRETTGIELRKLELRHIITHSRKNYILYMERLREYIDKR